MAWRECVICGEGFEAKTVGKYCSPTCKKSRLQMIIDSKPLKSCVECGSTFKPMGSKKTCSQKCSDELKVKTLKVCHERRKNRKGFKSRNAERQRSWRLKNPEAPRRYKSNWANRNPLNVARSRVRNYIRAQLGTEPPPIWWKRPRYFYY